MKVKHVLSREPPPHQSEYLQYLCNSCPMWIELLKFCLEI